MRFEVADTLDMSTPDAKRASYELLVAQVRSVLEGERDIFGMRWNGTEWTEEAVEGHSWVDGKWNGSTWTGECLCAASWSGPAWSGLSWSGLSWSGISWSGLGWSTIEWSSQ